MLFQTPVFFIFFAAIFTVYWALSNRLRWQNLALLLASYFFYAWWDVRFLILIVGGTAFAYTLGPAVAGERIDRKQLWEAMALALVGGLVSFGPDLGKNWPYLLLVIGLVGATVLLATLLNALPQSRRAHLSLVIGVVVNLVLLGFFKYYNFFADGFNHIVGLFGGKITWTTANIILPLGVSFFTFQKIAYLIEIRRKIVEPARDLLNFATFVAFFPQLVAGPIERPENLYVQIEKKRHFYGPDMVSGALLFLWGMYKKVVVADNLATITNMAFTHSATASAGELIVGLLAFTFQIYCDFSGYTDMARGSARMLGINLILNFNLPYFSRTPSEFWTRWHISLSSWLRSFLYISLGGNKHGVLRTYRNLFLTMLLGGLWHGANWTFLAWGAFHGFILILYRLADVDRRVMPVVDGWMVTNRPLGLLANGGLVLLMFVLTMFGWLLFRAPDMITVQNYLVGMFSAGHLSDGPWGELAQFLWFLVVVQCWQRWSGRLEFLAESPWLLRINLVLFLIFSLLFLAPREAADFIYFAF